MSFLCGGKPTSVAARSCILKMNSAGKTLQAQLNLMIFSSPFQLNYSILFCSILFSTPCCYYFKTKTLSLDCNVKVFPKLKLENRCEAKGIMEWLAFG